MRFCLFIALFCAATRAAFGVIFLESGDPSKNTSAPGDNSGWQYEGRFGGFLGTPIAPLYFLTAKHIGGAYGQIFDFHGEVFTTTDVFADPATDLIIWKVDRPFPSYAPIYLDTPQIGEELRVFGRGTQRGSERTLDGFLKGWNWGSGDTIERWGRNTVAAIVENGTYLQADFDSPGVPSEAHLSAGDSGGAVFIFKDGLWRLAAINYAVDDVFAPPADGSYQIVAALFDARGFYTTDSAGALVQITGSGNVPTSFYSTLTGHRAAWIQSVTGIDATLPALPPESFSMWQKLYFTPTEITTSGTSGLTDDIDHDGIPTLLEYAFNLDPTFAEPVLMTTGTGTRGLPLIRLETVAPNDDRLTVEFVRRTAGSGAGVTYAVQFTDDLNAVTWNQSGTEKVTPINARWERVKVTDTISASERRFSRVAVTPTPPS